MREAGVTPPRQAMPSRAAALRVTTLRLQARKSSCFRRGRGPCTLMR